MDLKKIKAKTGTQKSYLEAIDQHMLTFGIGPAGTGKTYLAVYKAAQALQTKEVNKIILVRPAIEAGEKLGFLPGGLNDKLDPYMRPLYDGLKDILGSVKATKYIEDGTVEIAPLAYMRGRTLNDAFIILDESQNTTKEQMKMFLTRIGYGTRVVVTGDITQRDTPKHVQSGLEDILDRIKVLKEVKIIRFDDQDVVRHKLVKKIVRLYED